MKEREREREREREFLLWTRAQTCLQYGSKEFFDDEFSVATGTLHSLLSLFFYETEHPL